jgi:hypothetical protein
MAIEDARRMQAVVGKRVRAYKDTRKYMEGNVPIHGVVKKVFVKGNSVSYKVLTAEGSMVTCSFIEMKMFQGY